MSDNPKERVKSWRIIKAVAPQTVSPSSSKNVIETQPLGSSHSSSRQTSSKRSSVIGTCITFSTSEVFGSRSGLSGRIVTKGCIRLLLPTVTIGSNLPRGFNPSVLIPISSLDSRHAVAHKSKSESSTRPPGKETSCL